GLIALALSPLGGSLREEKLALSSAYPSDGEGLTEFIEQTRATMERHPGDYLAPAIAARALLDQGNPEAVRYINRSLERHPTYATSHHVAARLLYRAGRPKQACVEYALATRYSERTRPLIEEVA